ncbi:MAG: nucleotidyl transferase AbiEii/AbiGii toxin family protein [Thermodesulfovibrionales bacterium]
MFKEILTDTQQRLLGLIRLFKNDFYMAGGTAIALHIGHRRSIDFDLFTDKSLDSLKIIRIIKKAGYVVEATLEEVAEELTIVVDGVKITFLEYPFKMKHEVNFDDIITMPDLLTLSAMKAYSLGRRSKWKDYVDLYFILRDHFSIKEISNRAREIFGAVFNERLFREQLCYFEDIDFSETIDFVNDFVSDMVIKDFFRTICTEI